MNENEKLPYNTVVDYDNGIINGRGVVVGIGISEQPVVGSGYIVKDISGNLPNDTFKYDTFLIYGIHLKIK